ncbi:MAG: Ig-like domain-containing protein [Bacilli bacterium]
MVKLFDPDVSSFNYMLEQVGKDLTLNNLIPIKAILSSIPVNTNNHDDKYISTLHPIKQGDLVDYLSSKWLIVSQVNGQRIVKYKGIMRKCTHLMTLNIGGILHKVPCIVTDKISLNTDSSTYISTLDNEIYILVANDAINSNIKINDIYKIGNLNYNVKNIDDISKSGLLYIKMDFSEEAQVLPVYSISITNTEPLETDTATPIQINIEQKDRDTVLTELLPVIFTSSDQAIATVDSTGLVTPVSVGDVIISVELESDSTVNDSITITIKEFPVVETYTLELTGDVQPDYEIIKDKTKTYTCVKKNSSGVAVEGALFDFTIDPETTPADKYTFTVLNDTQCTIKCNASLYYINLIATDRADSSLTVSKRIKLRALF